MLCGRLKTNWNINFLGVLSNMYINTYIILQVDAKQLPMYFSSHFTIREVVWLYF